LALVHLLMPLCGLSGAFEGSALAWASPLRPAPRSPALAGPRSEGGSLQHVARLQTWHRRSVEDDERGSAGAPPKQKEEAPIDFQEMWDLLQTGGWLYPARGFSRRRLVEGGARVGEAAAAATTGLTGLEKLGMVARAADGLPPVDDSWLVEQSGKLVPVVSGMLWPAAEVSVLILWAFAVALLILEEMQRPSLSALDVNVDVQRRRRINTVAFFTVSCVFMLTPPLPGFFDA